MASAVPAPKEDVLSPESIVLVRHHLQEVLASRAFTGSKRAQDFLRLIVGHALEGQLDSLRERMIGAEMFGRPVGYDTANDPVVRVKATDVRKKLAQYYFETQGKHAVRIELPSGSYVPRFRFETSVTTAPSPTKAAPESSGEPPGAPNGGRSDPSPDSTVDQALRLSGHKLRRAPRVLAAAALAFILIAVAGYAALKRWYFDPNPLGEIRSIAILPLANLSGDPGQDYFADAMTGELINDLGQVSNLRVISLTSAMSYKNTRKKLPEIARELAVDGVVEGAVQREGNQIQVSARLIDARTDRPLWAHTYSRDTTNVLAIQGEVAQTIAEEISIKVTPRRVRLARKRPVNTQAENLYLQGMRRLNADDLDTSTDLLQRAIEADPNSAAAHAALADCYGWIGESSGRAYSEAFLKQRSEAVKAVELDDSLAEGHSELANAALNLNWDWATARKEFQRARQLNPSSATILEKYAVFLAKTGKLSEAVEEINHALELDPVSDRSFRNAGFIYLVSRQYDQALSLTERANALNISRPDFFLLGSIYVEKGLYAKSIDEFLKSGNGPPVLGHLGNAYARAGQVDAARKTILELQEHVRKNDVGRYEIAIVYAGLGEKNKAFTWLEESFKAHDEGLTFLEADPCLDPLRSDQRFVDLVKRVGLIL